MTTPGIPGAAILALLALAGCTDWKSGTLDSRAPQLPGENEAKAATRLQGNVSLQSLLFPRVEGLEGIQAVDPFTGDLFEFHAVEFDEVMVVTLKLPMGETVSPYLIFACEDDNKTFSTRVTPTHKVSAYRNLRFGNHTLVLRDHGVEKELEVGKGVMIFPEEFATLWINNRLMQAARARFTNTGETGTFRIELSDSCQGFVQQDGRLTSERVVEVDRHECIGIVAEPRTLIPVGIQLERR